MLTLVRTLKHKPNHWLVASSTVQSRGSAAAPTRPVRVVTLFLTNRADKNLLPRNPLRYPPLHFKPSRKQKNKQTNKKKQPEVHTRRIQIFLITPCPQLGPHLAPARTPTSSQYRNVFRLWHSDTDFIE